MTETAENINSNVDDPLSVVIPITHATVNLGTLQATTPTTLVQSATEIATVLADVIRKRNLSVIIDKKPYIKCEGWTTLAVMLGVTAREVATVENNGIYTATVELVRMSDGACVSRASAECGADDEKDRYGKPTWSKRPRYARRSMAQTRATAKACRLAFSWIITLAGFEPTPYEEISFNEKEHTVGSKAEKTGKISNLQHQLLEQKIKSYGLERERVKAWMSRAWNVEHFPDLDPNQFSSLLFRLERWAGVITINTKQLDDEQLPI